MPFALGLAHSHRLDDRDAPIYFHAYHQSADGEIFMDVVAANSSSDAVRPVLVPSADRTAWDSFFVADPFVIRL